nr:MAG TPA: hypothetical protein [Crassvirales sp.]
MPVIACEGSSRLFRLYLHFIISSTGRRIELQRTFGLIR